MTTAVFQSPRTRGVRFSVANSPVHTTQKFAFAVILAATILSPLAAGGNIPAMWLLWTGLLGTLTASIIHFFAKDALQLFQKQRVVITLPLLVVVFIACQVLGVLSAPNFPVISTLSTSESMIAGLRVSGAMFYFFVCLWVFTASAFGPRIIKWCFAGLVSHAALALATAPVATTGVHDFVTGTFINHNSFATFMGMALILGLGLLLTPGTPRTLTIEKVLTFCGIAVCFSALFATQSRMGIVATLIACTVFVIFERRIRWFWLAFSIVGAAALFWAFGIATIERFLLVFSAAETRLALYDQVWTMIWQRPLSGYGAGPFPLAFEMFHAPPVTAEFVWDRAHSTYLTLWSELGLIVGSFPIIAGLLVAISLRRNIKAKPTFPAANIALSALVLCGLHSLVDFSLEMQANAFLLLTLLAFGLATPPQNTPLSGEFR